MGGGGEKSEKSPNQKICIANVLDIHCENSRVRQRERSRNQDPFSFSRGKPSAPPKVHSANFSTVMEAIHVPLVLALSKE